MSWWIRLSLCLFMGILLSSNICFADTRILGYSMPPQCINGKLVCRENEKVVCPDDPEKKVNYIPLETCDGEPKCIVDGSNDNDVSNDVEPECVVLAQCENGEASCPPDTIAKCPGNDDMQGCNCPNGSEPICEDKDTWGTISSVGSYN